MNRRTAMLCCALTLLINTVPAVAGDATLRAGQAAAICRPAEPLGSERWACDELVLHLEKLLGVAPVTADITGGAPAAPAIVIARADRLPKWAPKPGGAPLGEQEVWIHEADGRLYLVGGGHKGVLYATYIWLDDHAGVSWVWPGELGTVMPRVKTIDFAGLDRREAPAFAYRDLMNFKHPDHGVELPLWLMRNRTTPDKGRFKGYPEFWQMVEGYGLKATDIGFNRVAGHVFNRTMRPLDETFAQNPQWFPWMGGRYYLGGRNRMQPTLFGEGLLEHVVEYMQNEAARDTDITTFSLCPNDGFNGWSDGPVDTVFDGGDYWGPLAVVTDRVLQFTVEAGKRLRQTLPDAEVYTYAYTMRYKQPPLRWQKLPKYVGIDIVQQYNLHCDHLHNITDPSSAPNANFLPMLHRWREVVTGTLIYRNHVCLQPDRMIFPTWHTVADLYRHLADVGVDGVSHGMHQPFAANDPTIWLMTRLSWNPTQDPQALLNAHYREFFGEAAGEHLARYYHELSEAANNSSIYSDYGGFRFKAHDIYTPAVLKAAGQHLSRAQQAAAGDAMYAARVNAIAAAFELTQASLDAPRRTGRTVDLDRKAKQLVYTDQVEADNELADLVERMGQRPDARYLAVDPGRKRAAKPKRIDYVSIESPTLEVFVTPAAGGQIREIIHKPTGMTTFSPNGSYQAGLGPAFGWLEYGGRDDFAVVLHEPDRLVLRATLANGITSTRTLRLADDKLYVEAQFDTPMDVGDTQRYMIRPLLMPGADDDDDMAYVMIDGTWRRFDFRNTVATTQWFIKRDKPDGAWAIHDVEQDVAIVHRFAQQVDFCMLWDREQSGYTMEFNTPLRQFKPNTTWRIEHSYQFVPNASAMFADAPAMTWRDRNWPNFTYPTPPTDVGR